MGPIGKALASKRGELERFGRPGPLNVIFWAFSCEEGLFDWNKGAEELLGWSKKAILGRHPIDFLFTGKQVTHFEQILHALPKEPRKTVFLETQREDGVPLGVWWQFTYASCESPKKDLIFALGLPYQDSPLLLETLVTAVRTGTHMGLLADQDWKILDYFATLAKLGPYPEVVGKNLEELVPGLQLWRSLLHRMEVGVRREGSFRLRSELRAADGSTFLALIRGVHLPQLGCYLINVADLSSYVNLESELRWVYGRLRVLGYRLMELQREERERLASELHDEFAQSLTLLLWKLKEIEKDAPAQGPLMAKCAEVRQLVEGLHDQLRNLLSRLGASTISATPFREALAWLVEKFEQHFRLPCTLTFLGDVPELKGGRRSACFYIVREALLNAIRHAQASKVHVRVEAKKSRLYLSVSDDGIGMSKEKLREIQKSPGIRGMKKRAENVGGKLWIRSEEGQGTEVLLVLPLEGES